MRVEIVARLQVRRDQQDELGVGVVGRRAVDAHPGGIAEARAGRADVSVRVVAVDAPALEQLLHVAVYAWSPDVIRDFVMSFFEQGLTEETANNVQNLIPGDQTQCASAALDGA